MDAAVIRPTHRHRLAFALCAATAVHLGLLALPLPRPTPDIGVEALHVRLVAPAAAPAARPAEPSRPKPAPARPAPPAATAPTPAPTPPAEAVASATAENAPAPEARQPSVDALITAAVSEVRLALSRHFRYPLLARRRGWQGEVLLGVQVAADGSLGAPTVLRSSGHAVLDRAALEALAHIPMLSWAPGTAFTLQLPVFYRLEES